MSSHELNSLMIFIHPPLAIAGYVFVFLFTLALFLKRTRKKRRTRFLGLIAWFLTLLGLVTGMIWAEIAWGSYWSWDPKETLTLLLFTVISASLTFYYEEKLRLATGFSIASCILTIITALSSFILTGLHSFV